jgi:GTP-binding protein Era
MIPDPSIRAGYAAIAGLGNSGKSALMNALSGKTISPSHHGAYTTRVPITSIIFQGNLQMCFVDTPPLELHRDMDMLSRMDAICLTLDSRRLGEQLLSTAVQGLLKELPDTPFVIVPTFIDYIPQYLRGSLVNQVAFSGNYSAIVPVCAPGSQGTDALRTILAGSMPARGRLFPEGCSSLHSERFLVSEQVRMSLFAVLPPDVASTTGVQIEEYSIRDGKRYVRLNLNVARHSSKGIVIGRKGTTLQNIAEIASAGATRLLERSLFLDLWVKVRESWPGNPADLREFGYVC